MNAISQWGYHNKVKDTELNITLYIRIFYKKRRWYSMTIILPI